MPTIDLSTPPPRPPGVLGALPRRLSLTLPELRFVAERAGDAPLPFDPPSAATPDALGARLGPTRSSLDAEAYAAALATLHDPRSSLSRRGLLVDTAVDEGLLGAVGLLATPTLALDVDVSAGGTQVKAWHRQHAGAVASLATADGIVFELAWFPTDQWGDELARVAVVPADLPVRDSDVPAHAELPYELVDAATEAVRSGRADLLPVLVADHTGECRNAADEVVPDLEVVSLLSAFAAECRGRLRALAADVSGGSTSMIGVVSWVLVGDGWRTLRPRRDGGADRVEIVRIGAEDLARELSPVLAEVVA